MKLPLQRYIGILFILFAFYLLFSFFGYKQVYAATVTINYNSNPPASNKVSDSFCSGAMQECWNSWAVGQTDCGTPCTGGTPWTKHKYDSCYVNLEFEDVYIAWLPPTSAVCSTADKCTSTSNNPYLNAGRCDCTVLGQYKTCCTNTTPSLVSGNSCVQIAVDTTNPPYEGVCPAGSHSEFCGFGNNPACGQAACGSVSPTPPPIQCGATCSYSQADSSGNVTCHSGNCTDGSDNCSFNSNCSYVPGCSSGATVPCPAGPPPPSPLPPPAPDTQAPTCNNLALSATHGCPGQRVTITGSTSDNVEVTNMEFFRNPFSLASFNNSLHSNPFIKSYEWDTTGLAQGNYTIVVNASDAAGNVMRGLETSCNKQYTVDSQSQCQAPWISPSCSGSTFVGCHRQGQAVCTDYGTPCSLIKKSPEFFKSF